MADLQAFTAGVLARKEEELARDFQVVEAQEKTALESGLADIAATEAAEKARIDQKLAVEKTTALQRIQNQKRNSVLAARQERLLAVFDRAYETMVSWDEKTFTQFVDAVIATLDTSKTYQLTLGEQTKHSLRLPEHVTLSTDTLPNEAGFVLESEGIRYNYLYQALLSDMTQDMLGQLSQRIDQ